MRCEGGGAGVGTVGQMGFCVRGRGSGTEGGSAGCFESLVPFDVPKAPEPRTDCIVEPRLPTCLDPRGIGPPPIPRASLFGTGFEYANVI